MATRSTALGAVLLAFVASSGCATLPFGRNAGRVPAHTQSASARAVAEPDADLHPVILAYRDSLRPFLDARELAALEQVDYAGTSRGDSERLRFLAADHAVRRILPLVLEAEGSEVLDAHAARLRALPPLLNRDTDLVAQRAVISAMVALESARRGDIPRPPPSLEATVDAVTPNAERDPLDDALAAFPRERPYDVDPVGEAELAEALAQYAVAYSQAAGVSSLEGAAAAAAAADAMDVAFLAGRAMQRGAGRDAVFREALAIADELCGAARRRERLPRLHPHEEPAPAVR